MPAAVHRMADRAAIELQRDFAGQLGHFFPRLSDKAARAERREGSRAGQAQRGEFVRHGFRSSSISPAVALALPTTPGMPAPGWVPAPTR